MSFFSWNARGLGNQRAFRELKRLVAEKSPTLLSICETKILGYKCKKWKDVLGFNGSFSVDCKGKSGGLMLLWKPPFNVIIHSYSLGHIDCSIQHDEKHWRFTGFYGNPDTSRRHFSWDLLRRLNCMSEFSHLPWLVGGDFMRCVLTVKKLGDLHGVGDFFTWVNRRSTDDLIFARLDRFVATFEWRLLYPTSQAYSLESFHSGHRPILIDLRGSQKQPTSKPHLFQFEPHWLRETDCKDVVERGWCKSDISLSLPVRLLRCKESLRVWAGKRFRNLPRQIRLNRHQLNALKTHSTWHNSVHHIRVLEDEVEHLAYKEEVYWKQRSRVNWLAHGDRNSKYFHARASKRRSTNHIKGLVSSHGDWCIEQNGMAEIIDQYFRNLLSTNNPSADARRLVLDCVLPKIDEQLNATLCGLSQLLKYERRSLTCTQTKPQAQMGCRFSFFRNFGM
ncbi:uncharacterized protein [Primulina eburnea]|uniref:uncharacterized protein n=1 Tax=Primulina eburnea TaxID=1245227 RepID=UPI003C6BE76B